MAQDTIITSAQNPLIKQVRLLKEKSRERKKTGRFVIEGLKELALAIKGGYTIETLLICPDIFPGTKTELSHLSRITLSKPVYEKLAYRGSTEGVLAIATARKHDLPSIQLGNNPLILVAEAPEKPGNIGALLRTADAANLDAVLIANPRSDLYNPNIIRSSVGCAFTTTVGMGSSEEVIRFLKQHRVTIFCATLSASQNYTSSNFQTPAAIVVGTESTGLSPLWLEHSHQNIRIPMRGEIDSMNVSVSAAILIFEAIRQRES